MKCHKPGTDQSATLTVKANGFPCPEFNLPCSTTSDPNTIECFIPVTNGDQLTISGKFDGTCVHGAFDLLVDGTFVGDKRIEGLKSGDVKLWNRRLSFEKVFDTPIPTGYTSIYTPKAIVEGNLHARSLNDPLNPAQGDELSVGSLVVIISVNQKSSDSYMHSYGTTTCGNWRTSDRARAGDGGIAPTHELEVKVLDGGDAINKNRQSAHRRHFEQIRFGHKPWAKFIFYYRSRMAIETAGCVSRPDLSVALEPAAPGSFVAAAKKEDGRGKHSAKKNEMNLEMRGQELGDGDNATVRSLRQVSSVTSSVETTPSKPVRTRQPSPLTQERSSSSGLFVSMDSPATPTGLARVGQPSPSPRGRREADGLFVSPSPFEKSNLLTNRNRELETEIARRRGSIMESTEGEDDQALPGDEDMDEAPEQTFAASRSSSASENITLAQVKRPSIDHEPLNDNATSASDAIAAAEPSVSLEEIVALASERGVISTENLITFFDNRGITYTTGLEVVETVARKIGSNYLLKDRDASELLDKNTQSVDISVHEKEVPIMSNEDTEAVHIKAEPADKPKPTDQATKPLPRITSPASATAPNASAPLSLKRPLPNERGSRESTPRKRARFAELKARKAALDAAIAEKVKKKLEAEKALQEERKRREVEEEELLREIEEAERAGLMLDEETAELVKLKEMEETEED